MGIYETNGTESNTGCSDPTCTSCGYRRIQEQLEHIGRSIDYNMPIHSVEIAMRAIHFPALAN